MSPIEAGVMEFTPEKANSYLKENYDLQRRIRGGLVNTLARNMVNGTFYSVNTIQFAKNSDGALRLINGQHTLSAIVKSGSTQRLAYSIFHVETEHQVRLIYSHCDIGDNRTLADIVRICDYDTSLSAGDIGKIRSSTLFYMNKLRRGVKKFDKTYENDIKDAIRWEKEFLTIKEILKTGFDTNVTNKFTTVPVLFFALKSLRHEPKLGKKFWRGVANDSGLNYGDPRKSLLNWYQKWSLPTSGTKDIKRIAQSWRFSMVTVAVFKSFKYKRNLQTIRLPTELKLTEVDGIPGLYEDKE